jgi:AcrR family transcriptional regulator
VIDALLDLVQDGDPRPTAKAIAAHAGVSLRSVYVHFDDLDDLFLSAAGRHLEQVSEMLIDVPAQGTVRERAEMLMRVRGRIFEATAPIRWAAELYEHRSDALAAMLHDVREASRADLARIFAVELDLLEHDARARRLAMVDAVAGTHTWQALRTTGRLAIADAEQVAADTIVAILELP